VSDAPQPQPVVAFCPYCGQPLGSFFGTRLADGGSACDRCGECFRVVRVAEEETNQSGEVH
jgi:hypothetical protein